MPRAQNEALQIIKTIRFLSETHMGESSSSKPYEASRELLLLVLFLQIGCKSIKMPLGSSVKVDGVSRLCETPELLGRQCFGASKS